MPIVDRRIVLHAGIAAGPPAIIVRRARPGETMTTLDGQVRQLGPDMLLITDGAGPIAVAGVMGGLESEVTASTQNILLESANFNNINNRRTGQALKLPSEATLRFGKGIPAELTIPAAMRASEFMRYHAEGTIADGIADLYPVPQPKRVVPITAAEVKRIAGIDLTTEEIRGMLEALEFECERFGDVIQATAPMTRLDIEIPADLIEEVARMYGYNRIPLTLLADDLPVQRRNYRLEYEDKMRDVLAGSGLTEVVTYSLTGKATILATEPRPNGVRRKRVHQACQPPDQRPRIPAPLDDREPAGDHAGQLPLCRSGGHLRGRARLLAVRRMRSAR